MWKQVFGLSLVMGITLAGAGPAAVEEEETVAGEAPVEEATVEDEGPSLYERLGGVYPIALVVDDLIDRVAANDTLNANPDIYAARDEKRFPGLKFQLTAMVCMATGGPCNYTGKNMKDTHDGMNITAAEWDSLAADFKDSLDHFGVGDTEQNELLAIVGSTRADIVVE